MRIPALLSAFLIAATALLPAAGDVVQTVVDHARAHPAGDAPFTFDHAAFQGDLSSLPIGVFDSGIGGLTVLQAILEIDAFHNETLQPGADGVPDFANERFIYFGDQANMPYGNYSSAGKTDCLRELILKDALFLLGKRFRDGQEEPALRDDKPPVKAIVIACNTATAYGLEDVRAAIRAWSLPVIVVGVVEAGARGVQEAGADGREAVAVMATVGTCASQAYPKLISATLGRAGRTVPPMVQHGSPSLAGVIEGDPAYAESVAACAAREVRALADTHRESGATAPIGTVVLGCTHYPLAQSEIESAFAALRAEPGYAPLIAARRTYVNPAEWTARELFRSLASARLRNRSAGPATTSGTPSFFLSIANRQCSEAQLSADGALTAEYKYGRAPGRLDLEDTINVPLRPVMLPPASANLIRTRLPLVWQSLSSSQQESGGSSSR